MAREVLVADDGVSGARERQSVEALPEDREAYMGMLHSPTPPRASQGSRFLGMVGMVMVGRVSN